MDVGSGTPIATKLDMRLSLAAITLLALTGCSGMNMDESAGIQAEDAPTENDSTALMLDDFPSDYSHPELMP